MTQLKPVSPTISFKPNRIGIVGFASSTVSDRGNLDRVSPCRLLFTRVFLAEIAWAVVPGFERLGEL